MIRRPPRSTLFPLHDALPISSPPWTSATCASRSSVSNWRPSNSTAKRGLIRKRSSSNTIQSGRPKIPRSWSRVTRSEEHTSELQSLAYLVCRLLLEKKKHETRECQRDAHPRDALHRQPQPALPQHPVAERAADAALLAREISASRPFVKKTSAEILK